MHQVKFDRETSSSYKYAQKLALKLNIFWTASYVVDKDHVCSIALLRKTTFKLQHHIGLFIKEVWLVWLKQI